ncbi:MAG TPA: hypothetical protein PLP29_05670, partial [Candidatus Ozemobacteraceae bacterium]|nr:hypothetical protein [Candidatus Ozemobacteraceae bacterium]
TENSLRILNARRTIKKDSIAARLKEFRPIIAVIPCRKNYDFYPDLWRENILEDSLLEHAIKSCMSSPIFDHIVVTSDNPDARETLEKFSDPRLLFMGRNIEHTIPSCSIVASLEPIVRSLDARRSGITVLSYIQSPFISRHILEEAVHTLLVNDADSAFAVQEIHDPLLKRTPNGLVPINYSRGIRTDFDTIYLQARTASATKNINLKTGSLTGSKIVNFVVPKEESFFIENKKDLEIARLLSVRSVK